MNIFLDYKTDIALLLARLVLGVLFFMQAYDKIFGLGLKRTEEGAEEALERTKLPHGLIRFFTALTAFLELGGGILLIAGLYIYPALTLLSVDLLFVVFAMSLKEPMWDMRFVWPRLVLLLLLLMAPQQWDRISFDHLLQIYENHPGIING
ncbi:MAG TPA: DoxX family protein [Bacteroidia bacterium]|nr:DoxX family protein [Bacteroidia bacterium]